jgi:hypothetical protein
MHEGAVHPAPSATSSQPKPSTQKDAKQEESSDFFASSVFFAVKRNFLADC